MLSRLTKEVGLGDLYAAVAGAGGVCKQR
jgi:hypothetical protein